MAKRTTRTRKTAAKAEELKGLQLLGWIITWNARSESTHTFTDVQEALKTSDLDEGVTRELLPRFAFARACRKMSDDRLIDQVNETNEVIVFQFTRKFLQSEELKFEKETFLRLNKTTGTIECDDKKLQELAQTKLNAAMEERTTNDITKIVQKLFDQNADLFPVRDQGGVYFVPNEHSTFIAKIEAFLGKLGGTVTRFPVPAGTQHGDKAVQDSVAGSLESLIAEHNQAVEQFTLHTRADTMEAAAEKIKATRVKIEAYANYLQDRSGDLLKEVEAANKKLVARVKSLSDERAKLPATSEGGNRLFGHPVTAVIRWMGAQNWTFDEASEALVRHGVSIADATIKTQLGAGKKGTRGEPAKLSRQQIKELNA